MRIRPLLASVVVLGVLGQGCGGEPPPPPERHPPVFIMFGAPLFEPSVRVEQHTSAEALETVFETDTPIDSVVGWYRRALAASPWQLVGDHPAPDGTITLHAERDGPPLWVVIRPAPDGSGTRFSLIGAQRDTTSQTS